MHRRTLGGMISVRRLEFTLFDVLWSFIALELGHESWSQHVCDAGGIFGRVRVIESGLDSIRIVPNRTLVLILLLFKQCLCASVNRFDAHMLQI